MRRLRRLTALLIAVGWLLACAPRASAVLVDPFQVTIDFSASYGAQGFFSTQNSTAPLSVADSGSLTSTDPVFGGTGTSTGAASAFSSFDTSGLSMGVFTTVTSTATEDAFFYVGTTVATSIFVDSITLTGLPTGTSGLLHLEFLLDGSLTGTLFGSDPNFLVTGEGGITFGVSSSGGSTGFIDGSAPGGIEPSYPLLIVADLPYIFGVEDAFQVFLQAFATTDAVPGGPLASATADFSSTLSLVLAEVRDAAGNPVPGAQIASANGFDYTARPSSSVPEPSTAWQVLVGLSGFLVIRRRQVMGFLARRLHLWRRGA